MGHAKNSFAPARIDCRISSGSVVCAIAKIARAGWAARSRSIAPMPPLEDSLRVLVGAGG